MTEYQYPTEKQLRKIKNWDIMTQGVLELVDYIKELWWTPEWGFRLKGKHVKYLELHTGGWSGNESIIYALKTNLFWALFWRKAYVGGHWYFKIKNYNYKKEENYDGHKKSRGNGKGKEVNVK